VDVRSFAGSRFLSKFGWVSQLPNTSAFGPALRRAFPVVFEVKIILPSAIRCDSKQFDVDLIRLAPERAATPAVESVARQ
jgi:hypothetical protein